MAVMRVTFEVGIRTSSISLFLREKLYHDKLGFDLAARLDIDA